MEKVIDATNRSIGRVATEAAMTLMGKDRTDYKANVVVETQVVIENASQTKIAPKKLKDKEYQRYSGYPGGLKTRNLGEMLEKKGYAEVYKKAVYGMLPSNRLRKLRMKNLIVND